MAEQRNLLFGEVAVSFPLEQTRLTKIEPEERKLTQVQLVLFCNYYKDTVDEIETI